MLDDDDDDFVGGGEGENGRTYMYLNTFNMMV